MGYNPLRELPEKTPPYIIFRKRIASIMSEALASCGQSREDIASKMSLILGRKISKFMLDAYSSESRTEHTPAFDTAIAFDMALEKPVLSELFVSYLNGKIVTGNDIKFVEIALDIKQKEFLERKISDALKSIDN